MAAHLTPIEDLDRRILDLCTGINAATWELLIMIREFARDSRDNGYFKRPDGIGVPEVGYVSRVDENPPAGGLLSVAENSTREPLAPVYWHLRHSIEPQELLFPTPALKRRDDTRVLVLSTTATDPKATLRIAAFNVGFLVERCFVSFPIGFAALVTTVTA